MTNQSGSLYLVFLLIFSLRSNFSSEECDSDDDTVATSAEAGPTNLSTGNCLPCRMIWLVIIVYK